MWSLQVMDSLYQARVRKSETDLLIDQLKETFHYLTVQNKVRHALVVAKAPLLQMAVFVAMYALRLATTARTAYSMDVWLALLHLFSVTLSLQINMHKADKELSEVAARWEEIKKGTSQVAYGVHLLLTEEDCPCRNITSQLMLSTMRCCLYLTLAKACKITYFLSPW